MFLILRYFVLLLLLLLSSNSYSAIFDSLNFDIGLKSSFVRSNHKANFLYIPAVPNCCLPFTNTSGNGYLFGVYVNKELFSFFDLNLGLNFQSLSADFETKEFIGYSETQNKLVEVYSLHKLNTSIGYISINPEISYKPVSFIPIKFGIGMDIGSLIPKSFNQKEELDPGTIANGINYYDGNNKSSVRNVQSGNLPVSSIYYMLNLSAKYKIGLTDRMSVLPEIKFSLGLNNIIRTINWKINTLSFGLTLIYSQLHIPNEMKSEVPKELPDTSKVISLKPNDLQDQFVNPKPKMEENVIEVKQDSTLNKMVDLKQETRAKDDEKASKQPNEIGRNKETEKLSSEVPKESVKKECCCIIILSSPKKQYIEKYFDKIKKSDVIGLKFETWHNPSNNTDYYRIISDCFENYDIANIHKKNITGNILKLIPDAKMYIKCENK